MTINKGYLQIKSKIFWRPFGDLLGGIIGIKGQDGIIGKQRLNKRPVFFPLFPLFPLFPPRPETLGRVGHCRLLMKSP